mmetsp:Transcript_17058/g.40102  ORF Transcript_17058/g.40102 Transcript_17058/m.40102 type:complete len:207 (-) Transcript_17058:116-736(-)
MRQHWRGLVTSCAAAWEGCGLRRCHALPFCSCHLPGKSFIIFLLSAPDTARTCSWCSSSTCSALLLLKLSLQFPGDPLIFRHRFSCSSSWSPSSSTSACTCSRFPNLCASLDLVKLQGNRRYLLHEVEAILSNAHLPLLLHLVDLLPSLLHQNVDHLAQVRGEVHPDHLFQLLNGSSACLDSFFDGGDAAARAAATCTGPAPSGST